MLPFIWILAAMGVAYWAKLNGRKPWFWFVLSLVITPLGGTIALWVFDRYGILRSV
jgi:hypothetical protein